MTVRLLFLTLLVCSLGFDIVRLRRTSRFGRVSLALDGSATTEQGTTPSFLELSSNGIPAWLLQNCEKLGFTTPTLVQREALPTIFAGADVVLQAQTGSGKTLTYGLPVLSSIDPSRAAIQAVIVVPSRELGLQVAAVMKQLATGAPQRIMIMPLVEGSKNRRQQLWATADPPHVIVGNPVALQRLVDMGRLRLNAVSFVVLDEVDACLISSETRQELHRLLSQKLSSSYSSAELDDLQEDVASSGMQESLVYTDLARAQDKNVHLQYRVSRQTIMCSATIPQRQHFAQTCFSNGWTESVPALIHVSEGLAPQQVQHEHVECDPDRRFACLRYLVLKEIRELRAARAQVGEASNAGAGAAASQEAVDWAGRAFKAMVFSDDKTPEGLDSLQAACTSALAAAGEDPHEDGRPAGVVAVLTPSSSLDERGSAIKAFRDGATSILVCSGIGARGLDVPDTTHVFMTSLPETASEYLHRAGRAGRLGSMGKVLTLTHAGQAFVLSRYQNELGIDIKSRVVKGAIGGTGQTTQVPPAEDEGEEKEGEEEEKRKENKEPSPAKKSLFRRRPRGAKDE